MRDAGRLEDSFWETKTEWGLENRNVWINEWIIKEWKNV